MDYFIKHTVFTKVPLEECYKVTGKPPIKARWIDVDAITGDGVCPPEVGIGVALTHAVD